MPKEERRPKAGRAALKEQTAKGKAAKPAAPEKAALKERAGAKERSGRAQEAAVKVEAFAVTRYARISAKKANRILMLIRNRDVPDALNTLLFLNKPTKTPILKTLRSAVANAVQKAGRAKLKEEELFVEEARADGGPMLKRFQAAPHGRAMMIRRRTSHITVKVTQREA
jgi:large subunit ribosomal protein L22